MEITEIRVSLTEQNADRLRAFCSITFDDMFVVRDIKIIDGPNGPFVAMPSRRIMYHCNYCNAKNHLRARHCNDCGKALPQEGSHQESNRLYADIAHPINAKCREFVQSSIIQEFEKELERSTQPGYQRQLDDDEIQLSRKLRQKKHRHAPHSRPATPKEANVSSGQAENR